MNNEDKSMLDGIWEKLGLSKNDEPKTADPSQAEPSDVPNEEQASKIAGENIRAEQDVENNPEEPAAEEETKAESSDEETTEDVPEKKKDIKFLAIYTTVFVAVIGLLIAGSYMISYRIHRQMADSNNQSNVDFGQSTLQNVQDQRDAYKEKTELLTAENELLSQNQADNDLLIGSAGDSMEQDDCLLAAQGAYIKKDQELATSLMHAINYSKLSEPNKVYYKELAELLKLDLPAEEPTEVEETPATPEQKEEKIDSKPANTTPKKEQTKTEPEPTVEKETETKPEKEETKTEPEKEDTKEEEETKIEIDLPNNFNGIILPGYEAAS